MKWTTKDKRRVQAILDHIAAKTEDGLAGFARQIGRQSRQVVNNWRHRGRVPPAYHAHVIAAAAPEMTVTAPMLDPVTREVSAHLNRVPFAVSQIKGEIRG